MSVITMTRFTAGDWGICDWYRAHNVAATYDRTLTHRNSPTVTYTRHTIKEPPRCPPRQAWCSCGAILIVEDNEDDDASISAFVSKQLDGK